jgi:hypothetical protein
MSLAPLSLRYQGWRESLPRNAYSLDLTLLERDVRPIPCYPVQVRGEDILVFLE